MDHHQATQVLTDTVRTVTGVVRGADDAIATVVATLAADRDGLYQCQYQRSLTVLPAPAFAA